MDLGSLGVLEVKKQRLNKMLTKYKGITWKKKNFKNLTSNNVFFKKRVEYPIKDIVSC